SRQGCPRVEHRGHQGWSRNILAMKIDGRARERQGKALTNFAATLPPADSDLAAQVFKDPYLFDFLGTADPRREREVEQALVDLASLYSVETKGPVRAVKRHLDRFPGDFMLQLSQAEFENLRSRFGISSSWGESGRLEAQIRENLEGLARVVARGKG
ncbi:MAG: ORF6N domain-containing protein, partial [Candidatus Binatia bacterium]